MPCRSVNALIQKFYCGPLWVDGTRRFATLIGRYLQPGYRILDLGAGSGKEGPINFRGTVQAVFGLDSGRGIRNNAEIDHGVVGLAQALPFKAESFELVISDWAIEHLSDPEGTVSEVFRVLKPSGLFSFRTGNLHHYSYAIAAATPEWFHQLVADRVRGIAPRKGAIHPTYYRLNTRRRVRHCLARVGFVERELVMIEPEPSYLMFSAPSFLLGLAYERVVNRASRFAEFRACILGCFEKPKSRQTLDQKRLTGES